MPQHDKTLLARLGAMRNSLVQHLLILPLPLGTSIWRRWLAWWCCRRRHTLAERSWHGKGSIAFLKLDRRRCTLDGSATFMFETILSSLRVLLLLLAPLIQQRGGSLSFLLPLFHELVPQRPDVLDLDFALPTPCRKKTMLSNKATDAAQNVCERGACISLLRKWAAPPASVRPCPSCFSLLRKCAALSSTMPLLLRIAWPRISLSLEQALREAHRRWWSSLGPCR